ncbi:exodeoxyribonuclease V subunit gamma [Limnohabitans radicicola]|uniref:RecBCD enzyme subunit RecC n=1 Tax=Limnohabitans radicicola TaxID=2771427 RepID=A0A927FD63_9BURK|nr:exodeoxyribonuclease V subunit gamma [Limnohabitans radicicola]MBD8049215.1 exodeoxyribonuclease V subunit gamma [Limnohabitans radicicola]
MPASTISPGFIALHSHRAEVLADTLTGWLRTHPLLPLESEVVLVQSNGMAEWIKIELARQGGVCAATRVELPSRFLWRTYRQVLGKHNVPSDSPLDKLPMTWRLMALLPGCLQDPVFQPVAGFLRGDEPDRLLQLASRLADLFDQYQIYRPDWLQDWTAGRNVLRKAAGQDELGEDQLWQAELWRRVLATLDETQRQATRPALHARALAHLQSGQPLASPVARRVSVFGMSHMPGQLLEMLAALAAHSQVLLAVPNPCQYHWGDIIDGREWLQAERRRHAYRGEALAGLPLAQMHLHAPTLLAAWGRQGRDFIRQLDAFDDVRAALTLTQLNRLDFFDDVPGEDGTRLLAQLQRRIRDLEPSSSGTPAVPLREGDRSVTFSVAHSPVRELEVLHDQLLQWFHTTPGDRPLSPRDVVVMVPDIEVMAPAIRAVFGQYKRGDARFIPFDIADLGAQAVSPLIHAVQWLLALPQQRSRMSELVELLEVPALAARFGLKDEHLPTLTRWMAGSGIRWGLSAQHRAGLGLGVCGDDNSALFGVQRMLMGYACGADPLDDGASLGVSPYFEVGGLDAELAGSLAHLLQALIDWWQIGTQSATPVQWAERCRATLAALFKPRDDNDRNALAALDQALNDWVRACDEAGFAEAVPLAVARSAWLEALKTPRLEQRFRAGGVTFCTLMPMRAIPFQAVCLLGMNDGDYPRRSPRADFDLMGLPGMTRPGDRSRRDDDRQLMLEALLSARQVLYVSWSGRSVRDNSEQPPSVLVSQLRDEIDLLWGKDTAKGLTTVHPLQPFSRAYFEAGSGLQTYAKEWRAAQQDHRGDGGGSIIGAAGDRGEGAAPTGALVGAAPSPRWPALLPPLMAANEQAPIISLAQLARFLRKPVGAFFRERLQVHLEDERSALHDEELFGLGGLDLYQLLDHELQHVPADLSADELPSHAARVVQHLREAGALPLAGVGTLEAQKLTHILQTQLAAAWRERENYPHAAERVLVDLGQPQVGLQDALGGLLAGEGGQMLLSLRANKLVSISKAGKATALPEKLIDIWLQSLAAAAMDQPCKCVVVGRNALVRAEPQDTDAARAQLQALLATWAEGMRWPLPLPPGVALQWLKDKKNTNALADAYEGGDYNKSAEKDKDPALARTYPTLADLLATGEFERLAQKVYEPLKAWAERLHIDPLPDTPADDEGDEA